MPRAFSLSLSQDLDLDEQEARVASAADREVLRALPDDVALLEEAVPAVVDLEPVHDDHLLALPRTHEVEVLAVGREIERAAHHDVVGRALLAIDDREPAVLRDAHPGHVLPIGAEARRLLAEGVEGAGLAGLQLAPGA